MTISTQENILSSLRKPISKQVGSNVEFESPILYKVGILVEASDVAGQGRMHHKPL